MALITIDIPDTRAQDVFNALALRYGYTGEDTPAAKLEFVRQTCVRFLKDAVRTAEVAQAEAQARQQPEVPIT